VTRPFEICSHVSAVIQAPEWIQDPRETTVRPSLPLISDRMRVSAFMPSYRNFYEAAERGPALPEQQSTDHRQTQGGNIFSISFSHQVIYTHQVLCVSITPCFQPSLSPYILYIVPPNRERRRPSRLHRPLETLQPIIL
jgi:hypothetical protein